MEKRVYYKAIDAHCNNLEEELIALREENKRLREENKRLREALEEIASGKWASSGDCLGATYLELGVVKRARQALEGGGE